MNDPKHVPDAREALIDRERIRGATRMIPEGTDADHVTDEQILQVAADTEAFKNAQRLTHKDIARAIGYDSPGVISEFIGGKYKGNSRQLAIDLNAWLAEEEERRSRPQTTQFVWTNVALEIKAMAYYCLERRKIGLVYGPDTTGIGKTTALRAIYQELGPRRCSLVTIDKVDANPTGLLNKLCRAVHVTYTGKCSQKVQRIKEKLAGRSYLFLIDQIHSLRYAKNDDPLYILTDLQDATESSCAQLWCGTADMTAYLDRRRSKGDESLAQIRSRISPRVDLLEALRSNGGKGGGLLVTVEQVREMFAKNKLKLASAAARFLCELCNQPDSGAVRLCSQLVEYATMMAEGTRNITSIDLPLLQAAMRRVFSPKYTADLMNRIEDEQPRMIAKAG